MYNSQMIRPDGEDIIPTGKEITPVKVTFICMPWQSVNFGSFGLSLLKSILAQSKIEMEVVYLNLLFAHQIGQTLYQKLQYTAHSAELVFTPAAFNLEGDALNQWLDKAIPIITSETDLDANTVYQLITEEIPHYLDTCLQRVTWSKNQAVGFCLVYNQNLPSLALARRVKGQHPQMPILIGGASSFGVMGTRLVKEFDAFDVAIRGEAENIIVPTIQALAKGQVPTGVPGLSYAVANGAKRTVASTPPPPRTNLVELPLPDFDDYFEQRWSYEFTGQPWGSFESSRGCWWGERSTCSFCGLNGEAIVYRVKKPEQVVAEVRQMCDKYGVRFLSATDNILPANALEELLPALREVAEEYPSLEMYYQIKSNIGRKHAHLMWQAGIKTVQPGIESFSDHILKLMAKGSSAITQVQCLKFLSEKRFQVIYGILYGSFGETAQDYEDQCAILPCLIHLVPPSYFVKISLDRFSPYQEMPEKYHLHNLQAAAPFRLMYPESHIYIDEIARSFEFAYQNPEGVEADTALTQAIEAFRVGVTAWQENYVPDLLVYYQTDADTIHIRDGRCGEPKWVSLTAVEQAVFLMCEEACLKHKVIDTLQATFPPQEIEAAVDQLVQQRFMLAHKKSLLSLPLRRQPKRILGLTGRSCVGKTTLLRLFQEEGYQTFDIGQVLIDTLGFENYALPPQVKLERFGKGESIFHYLAPYIRQQLEEHDILIVDSLKASQDLNVLRQLLPEARVDLILVQAPDQVRHRRFTNRNRPGDEPTLTEKDKKIMNIGIQNLMAEPDFVITNEGSLDTLTRQLKDLIAQVLAQQTAYEEPA